MLCILLLGDGPGTLAVCNLAEGRAAEAPEAERAAFPGGRGRTRAVRATPLDAQGVS